MLAGTVLRLHAHYQIKQLLALIHLRGGLAAHPGLDHTFDIGDVDSVPRDFVAVHVDLYTGLPQFAHDGEFSEAGHLLKYSFDLDRLIFEHLKIRSKDLHRQRAFQSRKRLIHGIFGWLRKIENYPRVRFDLFLNVFGQVRFIVDRSLRPGRILIWFQPDIKFAVEESGWVGAIVRAGQFRADLCDHRVSHQNLANLRSEFGGFFERDGVGHSGANPHSSFIQVRHELAADERNQKQRRGKNHRGQNHCEVRTIQAPAKLRSVFVL